MIVVRRLVLIASIAAVSACGPALQYPTASRTSVAQEEALNTQMALKLLHERVNRIARVYDVLRVANADLCSQKSTPIIGARIVDRAMFTNADDRELVTNFYNLKGDPKVVDVNPNSPAEIAGLRAGDVVLNFGIGNAPMNEYSTRRVSSTEIRAALDKAGADTVTLAIARDGSIHRIQMRPLQGCSYTMKVAFQPVFNAFSDGAGIALATGVFNVIGDDDSELAFVIAHEYAHNELRHIEKMQGNVAIGGLFGLALDIGAAAAGVNTGGLGYRAGAQIGARAYSKEFEHEADYFAMYLLERAGYDPAKGISLFRRLSAENPQQITANYLSTHPSNAERIGAMREAVEEIAGKKSRGGALLPTLLAGQAITVRPIDQQSMLPVLTASQPIQTPPQPMVTAALVNQPPAVQAQTLIPLTPAPAVIASKQLAQLYLIRGPIVSNPPQAFSAEFLSSGKALVVLSSRRLLTGDFELFELDKPIQAKYSAKLVNPDNVKPISRADAKGFAALSDNSGTELECVYSFARATGRGEGTCADNQRNTYRLVFD